MNVPKPFISSLIAKTIFGSFFVCSMAVRAQSAVQTTSTFMPTFVVASIKPNDPNSMFTMVQMRFGQDGYSATHVTLKTLIEDAYGIRDKQLLDIPTWANSARFDIEAKTDSETAEELSKLDGAALTLAHERMLQALLAERFQFKMHWDQKELPVYSLVLANYGPKLHESKLGDTYETGLRTSAGDALGPHMMKFGGGQSGGEIGGQGVSLELLVQQLTTQLGQLVVDKTGLKGVYDFSLHWSVEDLSAPFPNGPRHEPQPSASTVDAAPSIFTAIQEQLGLKLSSSRGPVNVVIVDRLEQPSDN